MGYWDQRELHQVLLAAAALRNAHLLNCLRKPLAEAPTGAALLPACLPVMRGALSSWEFQVINIKAFFFCSSTCVQHSKQPTPERTAQIQAGESTGADAMWQEGPSHSRSFSVQTADWLTHARNFKVASCSRRTCHTHCFVLSGEICWSQRGFCCMYKSVTTNRRKRQNVYRIFCTMVSMQSALVALKSVYKSNQLIQHRK